MSSKKAHPLNGGNHTAGIFADPSIDGPEIGTLVLVVDRAKNLPNRKTIGKQDPYCAARLGKEAKKTTTDIRGGQTPRWDQELRFTVHESPDYYQIKVSVFNDDKKTDLIGEKWVDLHDIIVSGGGQSDQWHTLTCKGKYAGEVRIETTFYDSRPKPEKPAEAPRQATESEVGSVSSRAAPMKRRPLPSDPVTGKSPSTAIPEQAAPLRTQHGPRAPHISAQSPLQSLEYSAPSQAPRRRDTAEQYSPAPQSAGYGAPHRAEQPPPPQQQQRSRDRHDSHASQSHDQFNPDFNRHEHHDRHGSEASHYSASSASYQHQQFHDPMDMPADDDRPPPPPVHRTRNNSGAANDARFRNSHDMPPQVATPPSMRHGVLRNEAHRHSVPTTVPTTYPGRPSYKGFESAPTVPNGSHHNSPDSHQPSPPRHHSYDAGYGTNHRSMQPTVEDEPESPSYQQSFRQSGSRRPQYDYNEPPDFASASPAPLNLSGRGSAASGHYVSPGPAPVQHQAPPPVTTMVHHRHDPQGYATSPSPMSQNFNHRSPSPSPAHYETHDHHQRHYSDHGHNYHQSQEPEHDPSYTVPPVPPSLIPGVDPSFALELSSRINEERRQERRYTQPSTATPVRGRQMIEGPAHGYPQRGSQQAYSTPQSHQSSHQYDHSGAMVYSGGPAPNVVKPRAISPSPSRNPHHTIKRKSISPAPPPQPNDGRRLSGIPFGPDDFDVLNPSVVSTKSREADASDLNESGKIITHDGREIDPSDHLPMDTWAPEPEPKKPSTTGPRDLPSETVGMSASGRRQLRIAGHRATMNPSPHTFSSGHETPPSATARNRLQKKANRASAAPVMSHHSNGSSPLAPIMHHHQDNFTPPRQLPRASTFDYPNENHHPMYDGSPSGRGGMGLPPVPAKVPIGGGGGGSDMMMSGALGQPHHHRGGSWSGDRGHGGYGGGGGEQLTLMEEMSRIDIGTGRARRHRQGY